MDLWQVPDDPLQLTDRPVVPTAYFKPPDRDPATAAVERCALAVERPSLAPQLGMHEAALLNLAVETAKRPQAWEEAGESGMTIHATLAGLLRELSRDVQH
ncbi:hypothetical protein ACFYO1_29520 [Nocardia sp. NPDC006044]|uniref:hypothetical protein n=1 Tax=Nocardia sp. NPDC006044 TaxID=3364306 RepID=UPI0036CB0B86